MKKPLWILVAACMLAMPVASTLAQEAQHDTMKQDDKSGMKHDEMKDHDTMSGDMKKGEMAKGKKMKMKKSKKAKKDKMNKDEMKNDKSQM